MRAESELELVKTTRRGPVWIEVFVRARGPSNPALQEQRLLHGNPDRGAGLSIGLGGRVDGCRRIACATGRLRTAFAVAPAATAAAATVAQAPVAIEEGPVIAEFGEPLLDRKSVV